jgi:alpha-amylase
MKMEELMAYINVSKAKIQLFDVPLHYKFHYASKENGFDMSKILDNTLMQKCPELCLSFVENHDTQPLQGLESPVEPWFKQLGYAIILLRKQGIPCIFYPCMFGCQYSDKGKDGNIRQVNIPAVPGINDLSLTRHHFAYGEQRDYFDHPNTIGWIREGTDEKPGSGCAVVMTNGDEGYKDMEIGKKHANTIFIDVLKNRLDQIIVNHDGWARFPVNKRSVSVWIKKK